METKHGAGVIIINREDDKFLMLMRSDRVTSPGHWCWPGGMVDPGESPAEAARREAFEEAGMDLRDVDLHLIHRSETAAPRFVFHTFVAVVDKPREPRLNWESAAATWASWDELPEPMLPGAAAVVGSPHIRKRAMDFFSKKKSG